MKRSEVMKKRSEVSRAITDEIGYGHPPKKKTAAERTEPLPFHKGTIKCKECQETVKVEDCTERPDGQLECAECGAALGQASKEAAEEHKKEVPPKKSLSGQPDTSVLAVPDATLPKARGVATEVGVAPPYQVQLSENRLTVGWGECKFPVDQFNRFTTPSLFMSVQLAPNDDRVAVATQLMGELEKIADVAFERQATWYKRKLKYLGVEVDTKK